jgi:hypothetical protein
VRQGGAPTTKVVDDDEAINLKRPPKPFDIPRIT